AECDAQGGGGRDRPPPDRQLSRLDLHQGPAPRPLAPCAGPRPGGATPEGEADAWISRSPARLVADPRHGAAGRREPAAGGGGRLAFARGTGGAGDALREMRL